MKINKYWPFVFVYFFVNSVGLPGGLLYTTLLTPFLYYWVVKTRRTEILLPFAACALPFVIAQVLAGVDMGKYIVSWLNIIGVYIFAQAAYTFLITCKDVEKQFRRILYLNFAFCLIALPFYFTPYYDLFWISQAFTEGVTNFLRFRLWTYEASYYCVLFTPVFLFYFYQLMLKQNKGRVWKLVVLLAVPYIISLSIGVIACLAITCGLVYLLYFRPLTRKGRMLYLTLSGAVAVLAGLMFLIIFFPENALFVRLANIFAGHDASSSGRFEDAFYLSERILEFRNTWVGIGPGQLKVLGADIIRAYYHYQPDFDIITIPNATAETLVVFGWIGLVLRLVVQVGLFLYTKPWKNYYRMALFLFMFIYQFTGSFITSTAEYVIWVLAFTNVFPQFDVHLSRFIKPQSEITPIDARLQNL